MVHFLYSSEVILKVLTPWNYIGEGQNKWLECEVVRTWSHHYKIGNKMTVNAMNWNVLCV